MKIKCLAVLLLLVAAGHAQSANGNITAAGATCATTNACVILSKLQGGNGFRGRWNRRFWHIQRDFAV